MLSPSLTPSALVKSEEALLSLAPPGRSCSQEDPEGPPAPGQRSRGSAWRLAPSGLPTSVPSPHSPPPPSGHQECT